MTRPLTLVCLQRQSFKKFITYKKDFNELLLHLLRGLIQDAIRFEELTSRSNVHLTEVVVKVIDLEAKVRFCVSLSNRTDYCRLH
jgi:methyltransferase-like protein